MPSRFARTGIPGRFGKYDSVFSAFKFYGHVIDKLTEKAAREGLDTTSYVREILIAHAYGKDNVARMQREKLERIVSTSEESSAE